MFKIELSLIKNVSNISFLSPENSVIAIFDSISSSLYSSLLFLLLFDSLISHNYFFYLNQFHPFPNYYHLYYLYLTN